MKLGILTALWGRPTVTLIFLDRMKTIINKYGVQVIAVGSNDEYRAECEAREITYVDHENKPLGAKWNKGLSAVQHTDITNLMILGSDDLISDSFVEHELVFGEGIDFGGCRDLYMIGAHPKRKGWGQFYYFKYAGYLVGPGRLFSRRVLEALNWHGWADNRNSGLDGSMAKAIKGVEKVKRKSFTIKEHNLFLVDIKTPGNISGIPGGAKPVSGNMEDYLNYHLPDEAERILKLLP